MILLKDTKGVGGRGWEHSPGFLDPGLALLPPDPIAAFFPLLPFMLSLHHPGGTYPALHKLSLGEIFLFNTSQQSSHMGHRESVWVLSTEPSLGQDEKGPTTLLV